MSESSQLWRWGSACASLIADFFRGLKRLADPPGHPRDACRAAGEPRRRGFFASMTLSAPLAGAGCGSRPRWSEAREPPLGAPRGAAVRAGGAEAAAAHADEARVPEDRRDRRQLEQVELPDAGRDCRRRSILGRPRAAGAAGRGGAVPRGHERGRRPRARRPQRCQSMLDVGSRSSSLSRLGHGPKAASGGGTISRLANRHHSSRSLDPPSLGRWGRAGVAEGAMYENRDSRT